MAKTRRKYKGNATSTTIAAGLAAGASTATIAASTGWPTSGPFYCVVDPGLSTEEKIYVGTISGTSLSNITRGADDTTDQTHSAGCAIYPVFTAVDADEANELTSKYGARGSIVYQGATTFEELVKGTQGYPLVIGANDPSWAQLTATGLATDAVETAKIKDLNVTTGKLADGAVTTAKLGSAAVDENKLAASVAGNGLAGGAGSALSVNVDGTGIEINSDALRLKDAGVTAAKLATDAVETAKIKDGAVVTNALADGAVTEAKLNRTVCKVSRAGTIALNSQITVSWNVELSDASGFLTAPSTTLTVPTGCAGLYSIGYTATTGIYGSSTALSVNDIDMQTMSSSAGQPRGGVTIALNEGDTIKLKLTRTSGPSSSETYSTSMFVVRILS